MPSSENQLSISERSKDIMDTYLRMLEDSITILNSIHTDEAYINSFIVEAIFHLSQANYKLFEAIQLIK